jgi:thiol-disulfide isomerase/thioredoxin
MDLCKLKVRIFTGSTWCDECISYMPVVSRVLKNMGFDSDNVLLYDLPSYDVMSQQDRKYIQEMNITGVPTLSFFTPHDDKEITQARLVGALSEEQLRQKLYKIPVSYRTYPVHHKVHPVCKEVNK